LCQQGMVAAGLVDFDGANAAFGKAEAIATKLGNSVIESQVLGYRIAASVYACEPELEDQARRAVDILRGSPDLWSLAYVLAMLQLVRIMKGDLEEADVLGEEAQTAAERVGHVGALGMIARSRFHARWMRTGRIEEFATFCHRNLEHDRALTPNYALGQTHVALAQFWKGEWGDAVETAGIAMRVGVEMWGDGAPQGTFLLVGAYAGECDVRSVFEQNRSFVPVAGRVNSSGGWVFMARAIEGLAVVGEREAAASMYPQAAEIAERLVMIGWGFALLQKCSGIAAAAGRRWEEAERHFETALRQAQGIPYRVEQAEVRRWYAHMLRARDRDGDRAKARRLLEEALPIYEDIGMPRHREIARSMLSNG
jgi:hypothetical protein